MIPGSTPVLLDTGIIINLCRGGAAAEHLHARYELRTRRAAAWISAVSAGEVLAFAERNAWGREKRNTLALLFSTMVVIGIHHDPVLRAYAQLDVHLTRRGRRMGQQNDLWIAATAAATGAVILTTDKDFDDLHGAHLTREWVDPQVLRG